MKVCNLRKVELNFEQKWDRVSKIDYTCEFDFLFLNWNASQHDMSDDELEKVRNESSYIKATQKEAEQWFICFTPSFK